MCLLHYLQLPQLQLQLSQQWVLVPYTFYSTFHLSLLPVWFGSVVQGNTSEKTTHLFTLETIRMSRWVLLTSDVNIGTFCIKQLTLCKWGLLFCIFHFRYICSSFQIKELKNTGGANIAECTRNVMKKYVWFYQFSEGPSSAIKWSRHAIKIWIKFSVFRFLWKSSFLQYRQVTGKFNDIWVPLRIFFRDFF